MDGETDSVTRPALLATPRLVFGMAQRLQIAPVALRLARIAHLPPVVNDLV